MDKAGQQAPGTLLSLSFPDLDSQVPAQRFAWVPQTQAQSLVFTQQVLFQLRHLLGPILFDVLPKLPSSKSKDSKKASEPQRPKRFPTSTLTPPTPSLSLSSLFPVEEEERKTPLSCGLIKLEFKSYQVQGEV